MLPLSTRKLTISIPEYLLTFPDCSCNNLRKLHSSLVYLYKETSFVF